MLRLVLLALLIPSALAAQGLDDAARARDAVTRGEILRLSNVLPKVEAQFGRVLDAVLVKQGNVYTYEFDILTRDSRLIAVAVDAATGEVVAAARRAGGSNGGAGKGHPGGGRPGGQGGPGGDDDSGDDDDSDDDDDDGGGDDDGGDRD